MTAEQRRSLIEQYKAGYAEVVAALEGFPADQLTSHPIPGKWSAAQIVHHLGDSEMQSAIRIRKLLTEKHPIVQGYDQDHWAVALAYEERPIEPALAAFKAAREVTAQLLERMSDEDWRRHGWHNQAGAFHAEMWLDWYSKHAHDHAAQIRRLREALQEVILRCRDLRFDLTQRTLVMGIVNVTPDSFSDGGRFLAPEAAISHARQLLAEGADLLDLGAESTRPGSAPVEPDEQLRRLEPVLEALQRAPRAVISVDTRSARVAARALEMGAHMINDISALGDPDMARVVAGHEAGLVLMHMQGEPGTMQQAPRYTDVACEVAAFLRERSSLARQAGVANECIVLDPGLGFGKTFEHNLTLLGALEVFTALGRPVLVGASRKAFLGRLTGDATASDRLEASLAAATLAAWQGASILRVHDVAATRRALAVVSAVRAAGSSH